MNAKNSKKRHEVNAIDQYDIRRNNMCAYKSESTEERSKESNTREKQRNKSVKRRLRRRREIRKRRLERKVE